MKTVQQIDNVIIRVLHLIHYSRGIGKIIKVLIHMFLIFAYYYVNLYTIPMFSI